MPSQTDGHECVYLEHLAQYRLDGQRLKIAIAFEWHNAALHTEQERGHFGPGVALTLFLHLINRCATVAWVRLPHQYRMAIVSHRRMDLLQDKFAPEDA